MPAKFGWNTILVGTHLPPPLSSTPVCNLFYDFAKWDHTERFLLHHTVHFFSGFIPLPLGQLKSLAKSTLLERDPRIRNSPGECAPVLICCFKAPSRHFAHHTWPQLIQNNCFGVKSCPGNSFSSHWLPYSNLWSLTQSTVIVNVISSNAVVLEMVQNN